MAVVALSAALFAIFEAFSDAFHDESVIGIDFILFLLDIRVTGSESEVLDIHGG